MPAFNKSGQNLARSALTNRPRRSAMAATHIRIISPVETLSIPELLACVERQ